MQSGPRQTATPPAPGDAVESFLASLAHGDLPSLAEAICRDACFVTRDGTTIHGRERIGALLGQLVAAGLEVRPLSSHAIQVSDFALIATSWQLRLPAQPQLLLQRTDAMLALAEREGSWKLLLIAPWGWPRRP
jgi:ketosteroid isomerase-like protein